VSAPVGRQEPGSRVPTLPTGELVAAYGTYLEAQRAVDHLADKEFPVQNVTIVGTDLRMVERVTGRLTYGRVALAGGLSGAWFGLFVGLLLSIFSTEALFPILPAMAIGAAFGILFSVISYALTGGKRDFTSASQIVATSYALLCAPDLAHRARGLLAEIGGVRTPGSGQGSVVPPPSGPGYLGTGSGYGPGQGPGPGYPGPGYGPGTPPPSGPGYGPGTPPPPGGPVTPPSGPGEPPTTPPPPGA